jgi:hypothetical protein
MHNYDITLTEQDTRLPYFYTHFNGVKCPTCAESILERAPSEASNMAARYFTPRLLRCDHCLIYIGPATDSERDVG